MTEPTKPEPSEGARRAAEKIFDLAHEGAGWPISWTPPESVRYVAAIIDRETHSAEMRKALEKLLERIDVIGGWGAGMMQCDDVAVELGKENIEAARAALKGGAL